MKLKRFNENINESIESVNEENEFKEIISDMHIEYIPVDEEEGVALGGGFYAVVFRTHKGEFYVKVQEK